jgi:nitrite reductase/ring-hydroxylating ferredoxin subunit
MTKFKCNNFTVTSKQTIFATRYPQINYPELYFLKLSQSREHLIYNEVSKVENSYLSIDKPNQTYRPAGEGTIYGGYKHDVGKRTDTINIHENNKKIFGDVKSISWAAQDSSTNRGIPYIGYFSPKYRHCYLSCGYDKWGMTLSHVGARLLSDMILHNENPYELLYSPEYGNTTTSLASFGNIIKSSFKGMIVNRIAAPLHIDLRKGEGKVVRLGGKLYAIYKDDTEKLHFSKPYCRHLKCVVSFNHLEKTWDCRCHGSRYDSEGNLIEGPAESSLKKVDR